MENKMRAQRVAGKAIIESEQGILILKPSGIDQNKKWHIPGGIRDDIDEPLLSTAIREVSEETGINLEGIKQSIFRIGEWPANDKGEEVKILAVFFHFVLPQRPKIVLSEEHDNFAWINDRNIQEYEVNREVREIVSEIFGEVVKYLQ